MTSDAADASTPFITMAHTFSGTTTTGTTTQFSLATSRTATGGTASDNFINALFSRTNVTNGANLNSAGSVVKISGTDTQTANTLTPTYDLLLLSPSTRSTWKAINIQVPASIVTTIPNGFFNISFDNTQTLELTWMVLSQWTSSYWHFLVKLDSTITNSFSWGVLNIRNMSSATQKIEGQVPFWLSTWNNFNTNSSNYSTLISCCNENNVGTWYNTDIYIQNKSVDFISAWSATSGSWLQINQTWVNWTALGIRWYNSINCSTNGIVNITISDTQTWASVIQKIDTGTSSQAHIAHQILLYNASTTAKWISIAQSSTWTWIWYELTSSVLAWTNQFANWAHTASWTLVWTTVDKFTLASSRTHTEASSITDNYNVQIITRTNVVNNVWWTLASQWSVLKLANVVTTTTWTSTDTVIPLLVSQDADSTWKIVSFQTWTTERFGVSAVWNVHINAATDETWSVWVLSIANWTAPDAHVDNQIQIYSVDSADSTSTLGLFLEQAVEDIWTFTESHKIKVYINGVAYYISLDAV
jgi:hypothetical protein